MRASFVALHMSERYFSSRFLSSHTTDFPCFICLLGNQMFDFMVPKKLRHNPTTFFLEPHEKNIIYLGILVGCNINLILELL